MEWRENGIILGAKKHGESSAIADILTREHGRHAGIVRGGRSKRMRPILQQGNLVDVTWRARLSEHLGSFSVEPVKSYAGMAMSSRVRLAGLLTLTSLSSLLPEREPHQTLFDTASLVISNLEHDDVWPALLVRWEVGLLDALGFGLDLSACAATGQKNDLVYVSPKSGRAVSRAAGEAYKAKLFRLPPFLLNPGEVTSADIIDGFAISSFFLNRHIYAARGLTAPECRDRLVEYLRDAI